MNRRQALKLIAVGGAGSLAAGLPWTKQRVGSSSFYVVTDRPRQDLSNLRRAGRLGALEDYRIAVTRVEPSRQDLTLIESGRLLDPSIDLTENSELGRFSSQLRQRSHPGTSLLVVEKIRERDDGYVRFEVDGRLVDAIPITRNYREVNIEGRQGRTTFTFQGGRISIVDSSCRHGLCKKMSRHHSESIICAPNRLIARLPRESTVIGAVTG